MLLTYHGHSEFLLESASGFRILTDPYDGHVGYPLKTVRADAITVSHAHSDHNYINKVSGAQTVVTSPGETRLAIDCSVTGIAAFHDDCEGKKRGQTLMFLFEIDGLHIAHLGDLGCDLNEKQLAALQETDILLLPVGGYYTINAKQAFETVKRINPRIVIPMHYKTSANADWPIDGPEEFLSLFPPASCEAMPLLRVTKEDISCVPFVCMLSIQ